MDYTIKTINPLKAKSKKWSNTLKQFVVFLPTNSLNVFDHFVGLALEGLTHFILLLVSFANPENFRNLEVLSFSGGREKVA